MSVEQDLYAWVTQLPDGKWSLIGTLLESIHTPLIHSDIDVMMKFKPIAIAHGMIFKQPVELVKYVKAAISEYDLSANLTSRSHDCD